MNGRSGTRVINNKFKMNIRGAGREDGATQWVDTGRAIEAVLRGGGVGGVVIQMRGHDIGHGVHQQGRIIQRRCS